MTHRENILRAIRFETPEYIPMTFHINAACWHSYPQDSLQELMAGHPFLFPNFTPSNEPVTPKLAPNARANHPYTDRWGCVWESAEDGITGTVIQHPLADWSDFDDYAPPDPRKGDGVADYLHEGTDSENSTQPVVGGLRHGHTFLQLCDLRGYQNLLFDMVDDEPRLWKLIEMVEEFNMYFVRKAIDNRVDYVVYPEDLGMQHGPMLSPDHFRRFIKPSYQRLMKPARDSGLPVHMHSDGDIRDLVDDIIDGGVEVINLQDLVNGIDWIAEKFAGKVCVDLDIDRQAITPNGTPGEIDALIREEVEKIGSSKGGMMMIYGLYPGVPLANVEALMDAMERYAGYYSG